MTKKEIKEALVKRIQERLDDSEYSQIQRKAPIKISHGRPIAKAVITAASALERL